MGLCIDGEDDPALGDYAVEVRRESFRLIAPDGDEIELLIADLPKIRAALDLVEKHALVSP